MTNEKEFGNMIIMSSIAEIESAIERLGTVDFEKLKSWLNRHAQTRSQTLEERKIAAIRDTAGCLSPEDAESFARAVEEVGQDVPDTPHEW